MLDKEIEFFKRHKEELKLVYHGKYIVIKGRNVLGAYNSHQEAYNETIKDHAVGTFIIENLSAILKPN